MSPAPPRRKQERRGRCNGYAWVIPRYLSFDVDGDGGQLPQAVRRDEAELVFHLLRRGFEAAFQSQHAVLVDLRLAVGYDRLCDHGVEHRMLVDQILEHGA